MDASTVHARVPWSHAAVFAGAWAAAFGGAWWYWRRTSVPLAQAADTQAYDAAAAALLDLVAHPDRQHVLAMARVAVEQQRAPLYPAFLAALYGAAGGVDHAAAAVANIALFALVSGMVAIVAARHFGTFAGCVAAALMVTNPDLLFWSHFVLTEIPFTVLVLALAVVLDWPASGDPPARGRAMAAGAVAGLAALTRAVMLVYMPAVLAWLALGARRRSRRAIVSSTLAFLAAFLLGIAPWAALASEATGRIVPITEQGEGLFCGANSPEYLQYLRDALTRGAASNIQGTAAASVCPSLRERLLPPWPGAASMLQLYPWKLYYHLQFFNWSNVPSARVAVWSSAYWTAVWGLVALALARCPAARRRPGIWVAAGSLLLQPLLNVEPYFRFRTPVEPLLVLAAAEGAQLLWRRADVARRRAAPRPHSRR